MPGEPETAAITIQVLQCFSRQVSDPLLNILEMFTRLLVYNPDTILFEILSELGQVIFFMLLQRLSLINHCFYKMKEIRSQIETYLSIREKL